MKLDLLVVDDSWAMRKFVIKQARSCGIEVNDVMEAGDGVQALQAMERHKADVVLTDITMPEMNGIEFADKLRSDPRFTDTPVIIISSDTLDDRVRELQSRGAVGFIQKPFTPEKLNAELERLLGLAKLLIPAQA